MENNENITTEAVEEIMDAIPTGKSGLKTAAKFGVIGAATIAGWEFVVKPVARKIKKKIYAKKTNRKNKKIVEGEIDPLDVKIDEIPEVE